MEKVIMDDKVRNIVFVVEGGIGKVITSTAVVKRIKEEYPDKKLIVLSGCPELFKYDPNVHEAIRFDNPSGFYDRYIQDKESYIFKIEPYVDNEYVNHDKHLIDVWCNAIGIERKGAVPQLHFLKNELELAKSMYKEITEGGKKKLVLFQWIGGIVPPDQKEITLLDCKMKMHRRSIPQVVAQQVVNKLIAKKYAVGNISHENFPQMNGAKRVFFNLRGTLALTHYAEGFIGIDSFMHHAAVAVGLKGVVVWGGTNPAKLGYEQHRNLSKEVCRTPFCHRPDSYLFDGDANTGLWNCPFDEVCLDWTSDEIIKAFEEEVEKPKEEKKNANKKA